MLLFIQAHVFLLSELNIGFYYQTSLSGYALFNVRLVTVAGYEVHVSDRSSRPSVTALLLLVNLDSITFLSWFEIKVLKYLKKSFLSGYY